MSLPRYPSYKDSGVEWLGEVPSHWDISKLGFEAWVRARLGWKGLKAEEYVDNGYAFLSTPNIKNRVIDFINVNFITQERFDESPEIKLSEGDVILAKDGSTLGTVNVVRHLPRHATVNSSIAVITPHAKLISVYLYYVFASSFMTETIQLVKGGMGVPHLFQADLNKFHLPLPPIEEQTAIATFLDRETAKIDALVAEQQRLIELLQEKRQAVISHAVTKGLNPDAPMKPSGIEWLGDVPAHWLIVQSRRHFAQRNERAHDGDKQLTASQKHGVIYQSDFMQLEDQRVVQVIKGADILKHAELGDFVISMRSFQGGIERCKARGSISSAYVMLVPGHHVHSDYFAYLFKSQIYIQALQATTNLVRDGQALRYDNFTQVTLPLPSLEEQAEIAVYIAGEITRMDLLVSEAQRAIELLQERRAALISAAVTGQIDVRPTILEVRA